MFLKINPYFKKIFSTFLENNHNTSSVVVTPFNFCIILPGRNDLSISRLLLLLHVLVSSGLPRLSQGNTTSLWSLWILLLVVGSLWILLTVGLLWTLDSLSLSVELSNDKSSWSDKNASRLNRGVELKLLLLVVRTTVVVIGCGWLSRTGGVFLPIATIHSSCHVSTRPQISLNTPSLNLHC